MVFMTGGAFTPKAIAFLESVHNPKLGKPLELAQLDAAIAPAPARPPPVARVALRQ